MNKYVANRTFVLSCVFGFSLMVVYQAAFSGSHHLDGAPRPGTIEYKLVNLIRKTYDFLRKENIGGVMTQFHPQSPIYESTKDELIHRFEIQDLEYKIMEIDIVGQPAQYAFARLKDKTMHLSGANFQDRISEVILIFRREGTNWKIWSSHVFENRLLNA